jgi:membrane protease YdiL (CAAX protease family)
MTPPEPARNPDLDRRALRLELLVVLLVIWVPLFLSGVHYRGLQRHRSVDDELLGMATEAGFIGLLFYLLWRNHESWRHVGLRRCRWWLELLWSLLIYVAAWTGYIVLHRWMTILFGETARSGAAPERPETAYFFLLPLSTLVSAAFEELFIRGYLWNRLSRLTGSKIAALAGSSLLFTAYHPYSARELAFVFTFGVILGLFNWKGRSLPRLILAHALFKLSIVWGLYDRHWS